MFLEEDVLPIKVLKISSFFFILDKHCLYKTLMSLLRMY